MSLGRLGSVSFVVAVAGLIVACGGGNGGDAAGNPATSITIQATEFEFNPSRVTVQATQDVTITLDNLGSVEHEWTILKAGSTINTEAEFDESQVLFRVPSVAAGQSASGSFNVAAGSYQIICIIQGHFDAGMKGTLTASS